MKMPLLANGFPEMTMNKRCRALALFCGLLVMSCGSQELFAQKAVLYDFTATWCGPCQQMSPIVHKLEREGFPIQKVDIDQNPNLARQYSITSIPAFVLVVDGKPVAREVGLTSEHQLRRLLSSIPKPQADPAQNQILVQPQGQSSPAQHVVGGQNNGLEKPQLGQASPFPTAETLLSSNTPPPQSAPPVQNSAPQVWPAQQTPQQLPVAQPAIDQGAIIRAQFDNDANVTHPTPHVDSQAANVRLRIRDDKGINYGSGTIVESKPGATYVLTCGHIFRNLSESSKVDVDIFVQDRFESFVGKVEKYDLDADVGLVSIPTDGVLPVARLAVAPQQIATGDEVISVGCSGGQPPTTEQLSVTALNRYKGPDNIECTGVPVQGRSGGGLFNDANEVVGVCIAADPKEKRGLYAGLNPIVDLLSSCGLSHLIRKSAPEPAESILVQNENALPQGNQFAMGEPPAAVPAGMSAPQLTAPAINQAQAMQMMQSLAAAQGARLTILIEDPNKPGQPQVVIIPAATPKLLADLTGELQPRTVVANHPTSQEVSQIKVPEPARFLNTPERALRVEQRSDFVPTNYSAAQPYRRPSAPGSLQY